MHDGSTGISLQKFEDLKNCYFDKLKVNSAYGHIIFWNKGYRKEVQVLDLQSKKILFEQKGMLDSQNESL